MSIRHWFAVVRKEISHIFRDRYTLFLVFLSPTLLMLLMAYALSVDIKNIPIVVLDLDKSQISNRFILEITAGEDLDLYAYANQMEDIEYLLQRGNVKAAMVLSPGFGNEVMSTGILNLQFIIDGTEPESGGFAVEHISQRADAFIQDQFSDKFPSVELNAAPFELQINAWFNPSLKPRNDLIPGLLSIVLGLPAMLVALTIAREREHGTLEQLLATPVSRWEILLGKMTPYLIVGMFNVVFIPIFSIAWFKVPFNGNFLQFFLLSAIFMFAILGMGLVVGVFMRTQSAALALSFLLIFFPGFFLTGIFFPIVSMPDIMRLESLGMPGTHFGIITRGVFLTGVGFEVLWPYAVMLVGLGAIFIIIAGMFFQKRIG